jgi:DNA repair protein SbcD/Mre11
MRFIHCSDIHLGKTLGGNRQRYLDYFRAFERVVDETLERKADALVIAGDLFHKGSISPSTLSDTVDVLKLLKDAGVPVIAIEGNHDRYHRRKDESWLLYLSRQGFLKLLRPVEDPQSGSISFSPYSEELGWGSWIQIKSHTFYGLGYWGYSTGQQLARASKNLPDKADVGILHAGVWEQDFMDLGRVTRKEFRPLSQFFRYVALGHGHARYVVDDEKGVNFAYNPGSIEVVNREEADRGQDGLVYLVDISENPVKVEPINIKRRPYLNLKADVDGADDFQKALDMVRNYLENIEKKYRCEESPVIMLDITGRINFESSQLNPDACTELVEEIFNPVVTQVFNRTSLVRRSGRYAGSAANIDEIFRNAIYDLIKENPEYAPSADVLTGMVYQIQDEVERKDMDAKEMVEFLHRERVTLQEGSDSKHGDG